MEFEPIARLYIDQLLKQWDRLFDAAVKGGSGTEGQGWYGKDGRLWMDCLPCTSRCFRYARHPYHFLGYNYLAFDIIGIWCSVELLWSSPLMHSSR